MFNPKGTSLIDEQLAVSGLEMQIIEVFAGISAATSIIGGIMGSSQASKQNAAARRAAEEQRKAAKEAADATNKYNAEAFAAEKQNYFNNKAFQYDTAVKNWKYNQTIKDYEYKTVVERYGKSVENTENQLIFNSIAAVDAYEAEQSSLEDIRVEDAFNKQGSLVDRLQQEGQAQMGQAGVSRNKAIQSRLAGIGRNAAISDASLASSVEQSQRNMRAITLQKYAADMQAKSSMMIRPEALPNIPRPELGPDAIFVEPMKATPTYVPPARQVSTIAPIVSGIGSAASSLASVDWSNTFGGGGSIPGETWNSDMAVTTNQQYKY
jgi:hypothetical protein